jgi:pimeloyl-ACP methyl ester carboxylesterase
LDRFKQVKTMNIHFHKALQAARRYGLSNKPLQIILLSLIIGGTLRSQPRPTEHFAYVNGLKLHYQECGQGIPFIYLHAFTRSCTDWQDFAWLAQHFRIISIDLPGHGLSETMDTTLVYSHQKAAGYIITLLEQLKLDSVYLMGHSTGAMVGMYIATSKPELIVRQVLMSGQTFFSDTTRKIMAMQGPASAQPDRHASMTEKHGQARGMLLLNQFYHFRKLYGDPMFTPDLLGRIQAKTMIIHGDDDQIAPVDNAWQLFRAIAGAKLWIIPGGGHVPHIVSGNNEIFHHRLLQFFTQ